MTFEQAAALKILFGTEEVQVVSDGEPVLADDPSAGITVNRHGIIDVDVVIWDVEEAIERLAEVYEVDCQ